MSTNIQFKNRSEKINFLNKLTMGVAKVTDLESTCVEILQVWYRYNGKYINQSTMEELSEEEYTARKQKKRQRPILFIETDSPGLPISEQVEEEIYN